MESIVADRKEAVEPPRFCVDCQHVATNGSGDAKRFKCMAPQNVLKERDLVTGAKEYIYDSCYEARIAYDVNCCGKEGKWWVEKETKPPVYVDPPVRPPLPKRSADSLLSDLDKL